MFCRDDIQMTLKSVKSSLAVNTTSGFNEPILRVRMDLCRYLGPFPWRF